MALILSAFLAAGASLLSAAPSGKPWKGLSLVRALDRLQEMGLKIVYSTELVRPTMHVKAEPTTAAPERILEEILAPHHLFARHGAGGRLLVVPAPAPGAIRGVAVDARDGTALEAVLVEIPGRRERSATDEQGRFRITGLPPGHHPVTAFLPSYEKGRLDYVKVASGETAEVAFSLEPVSVASEAIVVAAEGTRVAERPGPAPRDHMAGEAIQAVPAATPDPMRAARSLASVSGQDGSAGVHLRGGASSDTQVLLDGVELYRPFHLMDRQGLTSVVDGAALSGLDALGAGFPVEYGGRMGGVLDLASADPREMPAAQAELSSEGARAAGSGTIPLADGRWLLSARAGDPGRTLEALSADPAYRPRTYDLFGKASFDLGGRSRLTFGLLGAMDDLWGEHANLVSGGGHGDDDDDEGELEHRNISAGGDFFTEAFSAQSWMALETRWGPAWTSRTILSAGRLEGRRTGDLQTQISIGDERTTSLVGLRQDWTREGERHRLKLGADLRRLEASYRYNVLPVDGAGATASPAGAVPAEERINATHAGEEAALYASDTIRFGDAVEVEAGLRWSTRTYAGEPDATLDPRLNLSWSIGDRSVLRAGWGIFSQPQRIDELQVEDGVDRFHRAQRSRHLFLGFDHELRGGMRLGLAAYEKRGLRLYPRYENLYDPYGFFPESDFDRVRLNPSSARARGIEASLAGPAGRRLAWRAALTRAVTEERLDGAWVPQSWDQAWSFSWDVVLKPSPAWEIDLTGSHHTGRPTTPLEATLVPGAGGASVLSVEPGALNSERLAPYHRIDLRAGRSFPMGSASLELFAGVWNLLGAENPCCVESFDVTLGAAGSPSVDRIDRPGLRRLLFYGIRWRY